ncbi:DUF3139 domain-containing protein [Neobacillus sp.]|uniref:DUF3139 domain-containing protein n=1 Tax=Neobacillus sp. TaxID=2675273 RepID=UPI00289C3912|nr:DUF3139 domain-containing protein [Neobacillus sp.]
MSKKFFLSICVFIFVLAVVIVWDINFPGYEKIAEERIETYMKAQKVDFDKEYQKKSSKEFKTGRWMIVYKFADEPNLIYEYEYDKSSNSVLLIVYESPLMIGGSSIESGMKYPSLKDGWSKFDSNGNLILTSK